MSENPYSARLSSPTEAETAPYRSVSRSAVMSLVLGVLSLLAYVFPPLLVFPLVGAVLGVSALSAIRRFPLEYTGRSLAVAGILLCLVNFSVAASWHAYEYSTEVPDGYERISFADLQPESGRPEPVPQRAIELSGDQVFIKGYMHPGISSGGKVNHFILVPDMGTCCFGGQPKPTDMIEVRVPDAYRTAYATRKIKLTGKFAVSSRPTDSLGLNNVWYHLDADKVTR